MHLRNLYTKAEYTKTTWHAIFLLLSSCYCEIVIAKNNIKLYYHLHANFNCGQTIWEKAEKSTKVTQDQKNFFICFAKFLTAITKSFEILILSLDFLKSWVSSCLTTRDATYILIVSITLILVDNCGTISTFFSCFTCRESILPLKRVNFQNNITIFVEISHYERTNDDNINVVTCKTCKTWSKDNIKMRIRTIRKIKIETRTTNIPLPTPPPPQKKTTTTKNQKQKRNIKKKTEMKERKNWNQKKQKIMKWKWKKKKKKGKRTHQKNKQKKIIIKQNENEKRKNGNEQGFFLSLSRGVEVPTMVHYLLLGLEALEIFGLWILHLNYWGYSQSLVSQVV